MKFKIVQNLENGKSRYYLSRGVNYTAVSADRFSYALMQYFAHRNIDVSSYRNGGVFVTEFGNEP